MIVRMTPSFIVVSYDINLPTRVKLQTVESISNFNIANQGMAYEQGNILKMTGVVNYSGHGHKVSITPPTSNPGYATEL